MNHFLHWTNLFSSFQAADQHCLASSFVSLTEKKQKKKTICRVLLREHEGSPRYFQHVVSLGNGHGCYWSSCDDMWCRSYLNNNEWSGVCVYMYVCAHSVLPPLGHRPADRKWVCCRECAAGFLSSSSRSVSAPLALTHSSRRCESDSLWSLMDPHHSPRPPRLHTHLRPWCRSTAATTPAGTPC